MSNHFDYIICGAGCAGLSLAYRLADPAFKNKRILLIDRELKNRNDRTWSFWSNLKHPHFHEVIHKSWSRLAFYSPGFQLSESILPYRYHTIRGIDFYSFVFDRIRQCNHIDFVQESIVKIVGSDDLAQVITEQNEYSADTIFDSTVQKMPNEAPLFVWQHFRGWIVQSDIPLFNPDEAVFMDFRIPQKEDTRFVYVLPFSENKGLIEATLFSRDFLTDAEYDQIISDYLEKYWGNPSIEVIETENGAIPMTTARFKTARPHIIPIGTANAIVKPSSGFAFSRIQAESDFIIGQLKKHDQVSRSYRRSPRFSAYDRTLLNVLLTKKESGQSVFTSLFKKNDTRKVLKFLDEETSIAEEIGIFSALPFVSFFKAFISTNVMGKTSQKR